LNRNKCHRKIEGDRGQKWILTWGGEIGKIPKIIKRLIDMNDLIVKALAVAIDLRIYRRNVFFCQIAEGGKGRIRPLGGQQWIVQIIDIDLSIRIGVSNRGDDLRPIGSELLRSHFPVSIEWIHQRSQSHLWRDQVTIIIVRIHGAGQLGQHDCPCQISRLRRNSIQAGYSGNKGAEQIIAADTDRDGVHIGQRSLQSKLPVQTSLQMVFPLQQIQQIL